MRAERHCATRRSVLTLLILAATRVRVLAGDETSGDFVAEIYRAAGGPGGDYNDGTSVFFDPATRKRFLSKRLRAALRAMEKRTPKGDAPDLDFDPVVAGNDPSVHDLKIKRASENAMQAVVIADFQSHDDKERTVLRYLLVREGEGWKVDDIIATGKDNWQVSKIIAGH